MLPYLKNKKDKTFLDQWLIGADLREYLEPWKRAQLNLVERVLLAERLANEQPATRRAHRRPGGCHAARCGSLQFPVQHGRAGERVGRRRYAGRTVMEAKSNEVRLGASWIRRLS